MSMHGAEALSGNEFEGVQQMPQKSQQKTLKFVTNYGAPHPKRRRIGAACLTCRKRKTACSGERPTCETCKQNKLECAGYASDSPASTRKRATSDVEGGTHEMDTTENGVPSRRNTTSGGAAPSLVPAETEDLPRKTPKQYSLNGYPAIDPRLSSNNDHGGNFLQSSDWLMSATNAGNVSPKAAAAPMAQPTSEIATEEEPKDSLFTRPRNRMPYFRWLGPTAIMPGFKQMVVKVKRQDTDLGRASTDGGAQGGIRSPSVNNYNTDQRGPLYAQTPAAIESDARTPLSLPFYDTSPVPPSELITHLANTFFTHLGCNYPFLQRERFLRDLEEKQVDAILVDAVCAIAARFSTHALLTSQASDESKTTPAEYGHAFAQRAKTALVDTFSCPTVAAVQAALLLAYVEFGESRDSGLWMYLGISIRMAQDLGLHKIEGLKYKGKTGPTPKMIKRESMNGSPELPNKLVGAKKSAKDAEVEREQARAKVVRETSESMFEAKDLADEEKAINEQKSVEQERVDTFWAVFFLDRVVSSGTGRRSTLRDKDIELSFPALDEPDPKSGWPAPFPPVIRIVHLYGRVADLLNSIKEPSDITSETPKRLASMESQVTNFYQGLSPRLHFDAVNFQHYMKAGEGTNFVLLHFWFHTLIVLLHQPTLLKTFEGRMLQLFPNSQQLSMSSAKTIADILSYSQLMDAKASLGNPFTTQPIYIAACAFLRETVEQTTTSTTHSRAGSPLLRTEKKENIILNSRPPSMPPTQDKRMSISELSNNSAPDASPKRKASASSLTVEQAKSSEKSKDSKDSGLSAAKTAGAIARHTLLATAASQHYQLCYKALQSLETYWSGTKYILTVLDQKFVGIGDPLLYTAEEGEDSMERPRPEPSFTSPGWRRKLSWAPYLYGPGAGPQVPASPGRDPAQAIGWTLTGTMNSPSTNLAWHYPSGGAQPHTPQQHLPPFSKITSLPSPGTFDLPGQNLPYPHHLRTTSSSSHQPPPLTSFPTNGSAVSNNPGDVMLSLDPHYQTNSGLPHGAGATGNAFGLQSNDMNGTPHSGFASGDPHDSAADNAFGSWLYNNMWHSNDNAAQSFGDMMIESQDVDMSVLGLDMMPWFDSYPSHDVMFDPSGHHASAHDPAGNGSGPHHTPQG